MNVNIKNYTSGVAVEQTVARIEAKLAAAGANQVIKVYGPDRRVAALMFQLVFEGRTFNVRLPANAQACFDAMWKAHCLKSRRVSPGAKERIADQASRTAWKLVQDWVDVQISLIVMRQAEWLQVFMAYLYDPASQRTVYDLAKGNGFKMLPCHTEETDENRIRSVQ